jgi:hypothetical protein
MDYNDDENDYDDQSNDNYYYYLFKLQMGFYPVAVVLQ